MHQDACCTRREQSTQSGAEHTSSWEQNTSATAVRCRCVLAGCKVKSGPLLCTQVAFVKNLPPPCYMISL
jgi:hypothetical protein